MIKHKDMPPAQRARVDAQAALGRKLQEYVNASNLTVNGQASEAYAQVKKREYDEALRVVVELAVAEGKEA